MNIVIDDLLYECNITYGACPERGRVVKVGMCSDDKKHRVTLLRPCKGNLSKNRLEAILLERMSDEGDILDIKSFGKPIQDLGVVSIWE